MTNPLKNQMRISPCLITFVFLGFLFLFHAVNSQDDPFTRNNFYSSRQLYPNIDNHKDDNQQKQQVVSMKLNNRDDGNYQRSKYNFQNYRESNDKQFQHQVDLKNRFPSIQPPTNLNSEQQQVVPKSSWFNRTSSYNSYSQTTVTSRPKVNLTNEIEEEITDDYEERIHLKHTFDNRHPLERFGSSANCGSSCHPPVGDLLIGRKERLSASSTCGVKKPERYCIVSHLAHRKKCFVCDSNYKNEKWKYHGIENIVTNNLDDKIKEFWWQAENGVEHVTIQFDLEAEFHFTHLVIVFQTFRPAAMLIERSSDKGQTWKVYQYYAHNCTESFPHIKQGQRQKIDDVTCESQYSSVEPSTMGEVIFKVLPPNIHIDDPYSEKVQELLKMTNLRVSFTRLHTLGDNLLDPREEIKEKYYYAINNMVVRGSCSCYGHASRCIPEPGQSSVHNMVYGKCDCGHNTKNDNCNACQDLYNDLEWKPAIGRQVNACQRCECNNHATSCTFNRTVFELSGGISGGVCNDCTHNTSGKNCQECKRFFYRNTALPINDPRVCEPCNCDMRGSLNDGVCDNKDDEKAGLSSGKCHCKTFADGPKCNVCKPGYWNLREDNPEGCEKCKCNTLGTIANRGCDQVTGDCACKPNVVGSDCNRCLKDHWGIDEGPEGCKPCNCDPGGSILSQCDIKTGQCVCRKGLTGLRCDQLEPNHYAPYLDHLRVEAENASSTSITKPLVREINNPNDVTWTGPGFDVMHENSAIEFEIKNTGSSNDYDAVIRYESRFPRPLKARVTVENIERPEYDIQEDVNLTCRPLPFRGVEQRTIILDPRERHSISEKPSLCLSKGYTYKFRIELEPDSSPDYRENLTVLVDSVFLYPNVYNTPVLAGAENERKAQEFKHFQCEASQLMVRKSYLHEQCLKTLRSVSFYVNDGASPCECDTTGSIETQCDPIGGQCKCRPNIVGRRCDKCSPGYHSFGVNGCEPCDCNPIGSLDNICSSSGQCQCKSSTYGKHCDLCQPGFYNYPSCERCNCNRHAELCDSRSGKCLECTDHTDGHNCEKCKVGYYGNPVIGYDLPCRACPCPGTQDTGVYHAHGCSLSRTGGPICQCEKGYVGERCDRCDVNYWGNPVDMECKKCECNGNVNFSDIEVCDPKDGRCLKCLFNTEGDSCERCKAGFYGDALKQNCAQCVCNSMGTNMTDPSNICDRKTGQCRCLPGVTGKECDQCLPDYWNLSSGKGCEQCGCDKSGAKHSQCNEFDGQCECANGYGGKQCNECEKDYYGDPRKQRCYPCNCVIPNAISTQCHKTNGTCICAKGNAGPKCDQCARGYTGSPPYCESCGECFENWDQIISGLKQHTMRLIESAKQINQTGLPGAYKDEFFEIESKLEEIDRIINGANISELDISSIENLVANLRQTLGEIERRLTEFTREIEKTSERLTDANLNLANLNNKVEELENDMKKLRDNATALVEENVEGAYNMTKEANRKSQSAKQTITNSAPILQQSEQLRKLTSKMLDDASVNYNENRVNNDGALSAIRRDIASLEKQIPEVNSLVCDGNSTVDMCQQMCGGAGCGKCGGIACEKGATTIVSKALEMGKIAEEKLNESKEKALAELNRIIESRNRVDEAYRVAQLSYDKVQNAKNSSDRMSSELKDLLVLIDKFLEESNAKPSAIRNLAEQCTALQISLKPDEIEKLARQINDTISSLTDIEKILKDTADDLGNANSLRDRADQAKTKADRMLNTAKQVLGALEEAVNAQSKAEQSINETLGHIDTARGHLKQIDEETSKAETGAEASQNNIFKLEERLTELKKRYTQNEYDVSKALEEANAADQLAKEADKGAKLLESRFEKADSVLKEKETVSGNVKEQAEKLKAKAMKLAEDASVKFSTLREIDDTFDENEKKLLDYSKTIEALNQKMKKYLEDIGAKSEFHRICNP